MKFNLNKKTSNHRSMDMITELLDEMTLKFCEDYDMHPSLNIRKYLLDHRRGLQELIKWMNAIGWKVEYWQLPDLGDGSGPVAYGLDFNTDCPLFMEARLKYS